MIPSFHHTFANHDLLKKSILAFTFAGLMSLSGCGTGSNASIVDDRKGTDYLSLLYWKMQKDSAGGIYYTIDFQNNSSKQIKYIYCSFFARNKVGDEVYCTIRGKGIRYVRVVGPLDPGKSTGRKKTDAYIYNNEANTGGFNALYIVNMDDTQVDFTVSMINDLMNEYNANKQSA